MAGGIRGIRALRVQRDAIQEQLGADQEGTGQAAADNGEAVDQFQMYFGKVSGQID